MKESLNARLANGEVLLGMGFMYPAAGIIEGAGRGWDWAWIDGQHGEMDYRTTLECVRVAQACGLLPVVRVPGHEYGFIGPAMDMAPAGIMIPMVDTAEQAQQLVESMRFGPSCRPRKWDFPSAAFSARGSSSPTDLAAIPKRLRSPSTMVVKSC